MSESRNNAARNWHAESVEDCAASLQTEVYRGLDEAVVAQRFSDCGPNRLPTAAKIGPWLRFILQFHNLLIYVLLVAAVASMLLGEWVDFGVILGVVLVNALIGFIQEGKAEKALDSIRGMLSIDANVIRAGKAQSIPADQLVPGDIVLLESGDKVPADIRLTETKNLRNEEAALTGESVPTEKKLDSVSTDASLGDRKCMAYSGTLVVSGRGRGIVVATGADTELGKINAMLYTAETMETPLLQQIAGFARILSLFILGLCALTFLFGWLLRGAEPAFLFMAVIGMAVAAIPEGLPAIITITLAIGVQRMAKRKAIIRKLPAVETLGSVSRICSDKTGTLTRNEMMVTDVLVSTRRYEVTGSGYCPEGELRPDGKAVAGSDALLIQLAKAGVLCNDARLLQKEGEWVVEGDPTEASLLPLAGKLGLDHETLRSAHPRENSIPFESEHRFMATLHGGKDGSVFYVKGAPEKILQHCSMALGINEPVPLDAVRWRDDAESIASRGRRVLALACIEYAAAVNAVSTETAVLPDNLTLIGLVGMIDPPRIEAMEAVAECHEAGIRVTMITGDHATTAVSIAYEIGIGDGKSVVSGTELEQLDDDELVELCRSVDVFARTSPEHKLRLVRAMQTSGQIVAMTGDGVNDAPALKQANVGIAMGIKGTEVSKEAAEMVLADDQFDSITAAVREGRTVYENIQKALLFILPTNGAQAMTIAAAIFLGKLLPITPPQILWVNMVTSVTLALALAFEPPEPGTMQRPPRPVDRPLLDLFGLWRLFFVSFALLGLTFGTFFILQEMGNEIELSRTAAINALIVGQIFYLLSSRYFLRSSLSAKVFSGNRAVPLAIGLIIVLQSGFTYLPWMQQLFGTAPLPTALWAWLVLGGLAVFLLIELEKMILRKLKDRI